MATSRTSKTKTKRSSTASRSASDSASASTPEMGDLIAHGRAARDDARVLADDAGKVVETAAAMARVQLDRNLYGTLLAAAGLGYVFGGGLPTRILALGATLAMRQASARAISEVVSRMQDGMAQAPAEGES